MIVHEDSAFGAGLAKLLNAQLPERGFQVLETIPHPTPTRDFNNVVLKIKAQQPRPRHPGELLQRVRAAGAHHAAAEGPAEGHLLGARRRGLVLQVRQGIPRGRPVHHGLQSLVRSEEPEGAGAEEEGRGQGRVLHLRSLHELLLRAAARRRAGARRAAPTAPRSSRRWRARPSPATSCPTARPSSSTARTRARRRSTPRCIDKDIQVILPGQVRLGEAGVPDAAGLTRSGRAANVRHAVAGHPRSRGPQRADDRRGLRAGRARADADLRRAAHHQLRPRRAADRGDVRGVLRLQAARPRSLSRGGLPDAAVLRARLWPAALRHRPGRARRGPQHPAGDARARRRHRERAAVCVPRRHPHHQPALRLRRRRGRHRVPRGAARHRLRRR